MTARQRKPRTTRRLTGLPSWPILLLAGREKAGKSYSAAQAAGSDLIGRVLWIGIGEDDPDEYGRLPGGDKIELVEHDGTYRDILDAAWWAAEQPSVDGKPTLIVVDSMTRLWNLLSDMAQDEATARARRNRKPINPDTGEATIGTDLWNRAGDRWYHIMQALRAHQGPTVVTARLDEVAVMVKGEPTGEKVQKVQAHKSLVYDVGGIVEMPARDSATLTGVRTTRLKQADRLPLPGFTIDKLWRDLGLAELHVGDRTHAAIDRDDVDPVVTQRVYLLRKIREAVNDNDARVREIAQAWARSHDGENIAETRNIEALQELVTELQVAASAEAGEAA